MVMVAVVVVVVVLHSVMPRAVLDAPVHVHGARVEAQRLRSNVPARSNHSDPQTPQQCTTTIKHRLSLTMATMGKPLFDHTRQRARASSIRST